MRSLCASLFAVLIAVSAARSEALPDTSIMTIYGNSGHYAVAAHPDGIHAVTAGFDGTVRIWNLVTGSLERILPGHRGMAYSVAISADGLTLVSGGLRLHHPNPAVPHRQPAPHHRRGISCAEPRTHAER